MIILVGVGTKNEPVKRTYFTKKKFEKPLDR